MAGPAGDCEWEERLQDWLDGELDASQSEALLAHVAHCESCREKMAALRLLDAQLSSCLPRAVLDEAFNRRVFASAQFVSRDLARARARLGREWQDQQAALLRGRRRLRNWIIVDLLGIALLAALAVMFLPLGQTSVRLDRLIALARYLGWLAPISLAAVSTAVAFTIMWVLATTERD